MSVNLSTDVCVRTEDRYKLTSSHLSPANSSAAAAHVQTPCPLLSDLIYTGESIKCIGVQMASAGTVAGRLCGFVGAARHDEFMSVYIY